MQRERAKRIDQEYQQLITDLRNGYNLKESLVEEYKKLPKDTNRAIYVKRISEIT